MDAWESGQLSPFFLEPCIPSSEQATFRSPLFFFKIGMLSGPPVVAVFPASRPSWPETPDKKSPIFSPDLEKGRGSLDFPPNVRDPPDEIPSSIIRPKPGTRPESRDSPIIRARQQVTSPGGGS